MGAVATLLTFEEFEQLPDQPGKRELLRGELIELPPAKLKHNEISDRICDQLKAALREAHVRGEAGELGRVFHEMGYLLPGEGWLQPDVSITQSAQAKGEYFMGAPAIAVEVVSSSNTAEEMDAKADLYFEFGAREVWRVYPKTKHVRIEVPGSARVIPFDSAITTPLLPGLALPVNEILGD